MDIVWEEDGFIDDGEMIILSKPSILRSAAGHYIGRLCKTVDSGMVEPYDRMSHYMSHKRCVECIGDYI